MFVTFMKLIFDGQKLSTTSETSKTTILHIKNSVQPRLSFVILRNDRFILFSVICLEFILLQIHKVVRPKLESLQDSENYLDISLQIAYRCEIVCEKMPRYQVSSLSLLAPVTRAIADPFNKYQLRRGSGKRVQSVMA